MRTNSTPVRQAMIKHVLGYFEEWAEYANMTPEECVREQVNTMRYAGHDQTEHVARDIVEGGTFLIYHQEIKDFLNGLGINPNRKEYDNEESWQMYIKLCVNAIKEILGE